MTTTEHRHFGPYAFDAGCPRCGAPVKLGSVTSTLIGWGRKVDGKWATLPEDDPNHKTAHAKCDACGLEFERHWKNRSRTAWCVAYDAWKDWRAKDGRLLVRDGIGNGYLIAGTPGCFERYLECPSTSSTAALRPSPPASSR